MRKNVYFFKEKYYTSEEELVYDIVNTVLSDYEFNNGTKMSYGQFNSIFPINIGSKRSYEPADNVKDDSRYRKKIELIDVDYYLYYWWDNDSLHQFVDNSGCKFIEYKNY